ncbi:hypothetical protein LTR62_007914 [Meristemomyces frigidus]|uniref:N-acetylgalactosaminide beta-1,3-galactosyltransferase n=1 Tax=Meristemomyces frigidus TaxID=1508187 RepID=A0AAN7YT13_9PEZI|nr:hypothetical protein LTR62_007914 [Meristemomyces frigidus]
MRYNARLGLLVTALVAAALIGLHLNISPPTIRTGWRPWSQRAVLPTKPSAEIDVEAPPCQWLAGAENVVVVMRTGATEIKAKLPVHLNTTFQCYPDTLIFSDYAEVFEGHQVHDVLAKVSNEVVETQGDFKHYRRLQKLGRVGLAQDELHAESLESGPVGKNDNPGWRLDKWKFLPMMTRTLELRPDKEWFIFIEPDTYVVWSNMVQWLQTLDPQKDSYYGSEVQIGTDVFAHGGSAFVMSNSAIRKAAAAYEADPDFWHARTAEHWAGDCILGKALKTTGIGLVWSWPMFQGGNPADMDWKERKDERRLWCSPALSYHHFEAYEVASMWGFEQQHILRLTGPRLHRSKDSILHHHDLFERYVVPNISTTRPNWTNMSPDLVPASSHMGVEECRTHCENLPGCVQFSSSVFGCSTGAELKMGRPAGGVSAGWTGGGVARWRKGFGGCNGVGWWTSGWAQS